MSKYQNLLNSSHRSAAHSTVICATTFKEVVNYYRIRYCCFVDATKAFDRVHIGKLFEMVLSCNKSLPAFLQYLTRNQAINLMPSG